jgi:hypothetical protein
LHERGFGASNNRLTTAEADWNQFARAERARSLGVSPSTVRLLEALRAGAAPACTIHEYNELRSLLLSKVKLNAGPAGGYVVQPRSDRKMLSLAIDAIYKLGPGLSRSDLYAVTRLSAASPSTSGGRPTGSRTPPTAAKALLQLLQAGLLDPKPRMSPRQLRALDLARAALAGAAELRPRQST